MRIKAIQAHAQGTFEVEEFSDMGFRGHFQAPLGSRANAWWEGAVMPSRNINLIQYNVTTRIKVLPRVT